MNYSKQDAKAYAKAIALKPDGEGYNSAYGEALVQEAGTALDSTMTVVQRMNGVASEIALANREQASGVTQIDQAVTEIDRTTQETAALMEQAGAIEDATAVVADDAAP